MSTSMQHNKLFGLKSMITDSNNSDSESKTDAMIKADQETDLKYCKSFSLHALYS